MGWTLCVSRGRSNLAGVDNSVSAPQARAQAKFFCSSYLYAVLSTYCLMKIDTRTWSGVPRSTLSVRCVRTILRATAKERFSTVLRSRPAWPVLHLSFITLPSRCAVGAKKILMKGFGFGGVDRSCFAQGFKGCAERVSWVCLENLLVGALVMEELS